MMRMCLDGVSEAIFFVESFEKREDSSHYLCLDEDRRIHGVEPLDEIAMKYTCNSFLAVSQGLIQGKTHLEGI